MSPARTFGEAFVTLFVIMDPPGTLPVFLALTASMTTRQRTRAATQGVLVALVVIVVFALFGRRILDYLHVSLPALQCAGGLLLLLVALQLLTGQEADLTRAEGVNIALVPLGTPLLAGPGAIVATMVLVSGVNTPAGYTAVAVAILAVHLCLWLVLVFATVIHKVLRDSGVTLVSRISGLLLSAIAVQLIADAVHAFVTGSPSP